MRKLLLLLALASAFPLFAQDRSNPLGGDIRAQSTACGVVSSCVWQKLPVGSTTETITVSNGPIGSFSATLQFEQSNDGINFVAASPASTTTPGTFTFTITGFTDFRVRASIYASGDAAINMQAAGSGSGGGGGGGGSSFPVTTAVTVSSGGSITPTGTGSIIATGIPANTPAVPSMLGPGFNVNNYGDKDDARTCNSVSTVGGGSFTFTGTCNFTTADIGKQFVLNAADGSFSTFASSTTISVINSTTSINASQANVGGAFTGVALMGTIADAAWQSAMAGVIAQEKGISQSGNTATMTAAPALLAPAGGHLLCRTDLDQFAPAAGSGAAFRGDGRDQTFIYSIGNANGCAAGASASIANIAGSVSNILITGMTIDGANNGCSGSPAAIAGSGSFRLVEVIIQRWCVNSNGASPAYGLTAQGGIWTEFLIVVNNGGGINCNQCQGELHDPISSNNGGGSVNAVNLRVQNSVALQNGSGLVIWGGLFDECGAQPLACDQFINSHDVRLIGGAYFSTNSGAAISVDLNTTIHMSMIVAGVFGNDSNASGLKIAAGGEATSASSRFVSTGTGKAVNNLGVFRNEGGNTYESMFVIVSGTSTGTTVVLTLTPVTSNVNTNCSIGDAYETQGAAIAGYDGYSPPNGTIGGTGAGNSVVTGLTAVTATTATYISIGSNMGALGAGGVMMCKNQFVYSGNIPLTDQTNAANTWIQPTFATGVTFGNQIIKQAMAVTDLAVVSQSAVVTTCATPPVFTLTDGTNTVTITLTSGKTAWTTSGGSPDAHTGLGQSYKPGALITGSFTVGVCATPPVSPSVTYNWQSLGDN